MIDIRQFPDSFLQPARSTFPWAGARSHTMWMVLLLVSALSGCDSKKDRISSARPPSVKKSRTAVEQPAPEADRDEQWAAEPEKEDPEPAGSQEPADPPAPASECNLEGTWQESWNGKSLKDGATLRGEAVVTIRRKKGVLEARGVDARSKSHRWVGTLRQEGPEIVYEYHAEDWTHQGTYRCEAKDCDALSCEIEAADRTGKPNLRGTSSWTRASLTRKGGRP